MQAIGKVAIAAKIWNHVLWGFDVLKTDNGSVHRNAANKLNNETRAARGSVCNALLSRVCPHELNYIFNAVSLERLQVAYFDFRIFEDVRKP